MPTQHAATSSAAALRHFYNEMEVSEEEQRVLFEEYGIGDGRALLAHSRRMYDKKLVGVSPQMQLTLAVAAMLMDRKASKSATLTVQDLLASFDREEHVFEVMDCGSEGGNAGPGIPIALSADDSATTSGDEEMEQASAEAGSTGDEEDEASVAGAARPSSAASRGENDEDEQEDGGLALSIEEKQELEERAAASDLEMMLQGFGRAAGSDSSIGYGSAGPSNATLVDDRDHVVYQGKMFYRGKCYLYRKEDGKVVTIGIKSFSSDLMFVKDFVLVVPFSSTFAGMDDGGDHPFADDPDSHDFESVQVRTDRQDPLPLFRFEECSDPAPIPELCYKPQSRSESWQAFEYYYEHNTDTTVGLRKEMRVVDLYCGAGGMDLGYKNEGFVTVKAVDLDSAAIKTFVRNNNQDEKLAYKGTVQQFLDDLQSNKGGWGDEMKETTVAHASPPCQGFSAANIDGGKNDEANRRQSLLFVEILRILQSPFGTFENVEGMWRRKHVHYLRKIINDLLGLGYQARCTPTP